MLPPFLKRKWPKIANPMDEMSYGGSMADQIEEHCISELMDAVKSDDLPMFRKALEALILNCFDEENSDAA